MTLSDYFRLKSGNQASLVRALGLPQTTVAHWASRSRSVPAEYCVSIEQATGGAVTRKDLLPNTWSAIWPELAAAPADHGINVSAAIAAARHVFEGDKVAEDVLHYIEQVLGAGAPVPAQTGITTGAHNACVAAREAVMHQARADLAQGEGAPVAGSEWPAWARDLDKLAGDVKQIEVATGNLFSELANILGTVGADTFDQAAAAMAAESAEMVADAERSVAARAGAVISTLVVEVDTTQLDAALAKAERLQVLLAGLALGGASS